MPKKQCSTTLVHAGHIRGVEETSPLVVLMPQTNPFMFHPHLVGCNHAYATNPSHLPCSHARLPHPAAQMRLWLQKPLHTSCPSPQLKCKSVRAWRYFLSCLRSSLRLLEDITICCVSWPPPMFVWPSSMFVVPIALESC